jgi:hypothetical protein
MDHRFIDYPKKFKTQVLLQSKPQPSIAVKMSKPNNVLVNMVAIVVTQNKFVPKLCFQRQGVVEVKTRLQDKELLKSHSASIIQCPIASSSPFFCKLFVCKMKWNKEEQFQQTFMDTIREMKNDKMFELYDQATDFSTSCVHWRILNLSRS